MSQDSGKDVFAMFMDDVGVPRAKTQTLEFKDSSGYGTVRYAKAASSKRLELSEEWSLHEILEPKDIQGLYLIYNRQTEERWIEWTVEDRNDADFGKTYFENLRSGKTTWELRGVRVQSPPVSIPPITPHIENTPSTNSSVHIYRSPRSRSNVSTVSTASDADILGTAVPRGSVLASLSMRSPGVIETPSPGIPVEYRRQLKSNNSSGGSSIRRMSSLKKRRQSSSPSLIRAAESSARRRNSRRLSIRLKTSESSQSIQSIDEPSPRSRFSRRKSVLSTLQSDENTFYRTSCSKLL